MTTALNENLRKVRTSFTMTQEELAHKVHMSKSNYSNFERGEYEITEEKLKLFANGMGCTPDYIRNFEEYRAQHIHISQCQTGVGIGIHNQQSNPEGMKALLAAVMKNLEQNSQNIEQNNRNIEQTNKLIELVLQRLAPAQSVQTNGNT